MSYSVLGGKKSSMIKLFYVVCIGLSKIIKITSFADHLLFKVLLINHLLFKDQRQFFMQTDSY